MNSNNNLIFAIIENDIVINVIIVEDAEIVKTLYPQKEYVQVIDNELGMNYFRENGKWYPPKPSENAIWNEEFSFWQKDSDTDALDIV